LLTLEGFEKFSSKLVLDSGKPLVLEPFQAELVRDFTDPNVRETWCVLPESSGKSTLLAAYSCYVLASVRGATVVVASVSQQQAGSALFRQASDLISRSPGLAKHLRAVDGRLKIYGPGRSRLDVKPSTTATAQGAIPSLVICDEVGELSSLDLVRLFRGKLSKRDGAKLIVISSAGEPGSEFERALEEIRNGAEHVDRDGRHSRYRTGATVVHEWRLAEGDDLTDFALLKSANPLSRTTAESLQEKWESPTTNRSWFSRYTGGRAEYSEDHVVSRDVWESAAVDFTELDGEVFFRQLIGLDFAQSYDDLALVPATVHRSGLVLLGPALLLEPNRPGEPVALEDMQDAVLELVESLGGVYEVWLNPAAGSSPLEEWIAAHIAEVVCYGMTQPEALDLTEVFLSALHAGELKHTGDGALQQHVLNATARYAWDQDRFSFTRPKESRRAKVQDTRRIDALSAATLAVKGAAVALQSL
jgi:phage terminase large subunit-like protein